MARPLVGDRWVTGAVITPSGTPHSPRRWTQTKGAHNRCSGHGRPCLDRLVPIRPAPKRGTGPLAARPDPKILRRGGSPRQPGTRPVLAESRATRVAPAPPLDPRRPERSAPVGASRFGVTRPEGRVPRSGTGSGAVAPFPRVRFRVPRRSSTYTLSASCQAVKYVRGIRCLLCGGGDTASPGRRCGVGTKVGRQRWLRRGVRGAIIEHQARKIVVAGRNPRGARTPFVG